MSSSLFSSDRLAPAHSTHWLPLSPTLTRGPSHRRLERRSSRGKNSTGRPRRLQMPPNSTRSPLGDVTDLVLSTEYSSSAIPWADPTTPVGSPYSTAGYSASADTTHSIPRNQYPPTGKRPKRVHWADVEGEAYAYSTPPMTPQIGRLKTPELEPVKACSRFCECCRDERRYQEGRAKMDSQRRCIPTLSCCRPLGRR